MKDITPKWWVTRQVEAFIEILVLVCKEIGCHPTELVPNMDPNADIIIKATKELTKLSKKSAKK